MTLESLGSAVHWPAPAKLNLCLHIIGRRPDGYHLLQSAMQFIDLRDELMFYRRPPGVVERIAGPEGVPPEADLSIRAARLLAPHASAAGVAIELHKRIPMQAGLGGGSSDAATVLVALNKLWDINMPLPDLAALGLELGADVPVFVRGHAAWVEGIGEQLTAADYPESVYLVVRPDATVSTADIFTAPELTRNTPVTTIRAFRELGGTNDCTSTVRARYPQVSKALDWLSDFGAARLTGTGACVFAEMDDEETAARALARVPREMAGQWAGYIVRGLNRSPLLARLAAESGQ